MSLRKKKEVLICVSFFSSFFCHNTNLSVLAMSRDIKSFSTQIAALQQELKMIKWHLPRCKRMERMRLCECGCVLGHMPKTLCRKCFRERWNYDERVAYARLKYHNKFVENQ